MELIELASKAATREKISVHLPEYVMHSTVTEHMLLHSKSSRKNRQTSHSKKMNEQVEPPANPAK